MFVMVERAVRQVDIEPEARSLGFIMLKPLGTTEPFRSEIIKQISSIGSIEAIRPHTLTRTEASALYSLSGHDEEGNPLPHFHAIVNYLTGKQIELLLVSGGRNLITEIDKLIGQWQPENTHTGQMRHLLIEYGVQYMMDVDTPEGSNKYCYDNLVHSSDSQESANREMRIWFSEEEIKGAFGK